MIDRILGYCPRCGKCYAVKIGELIVCDVCKKAVMKEFSNPFCFDTVDLDAIFSPANKAAIEALVKASPEFDQDAWDRRVRIESGEEPDPSYVPTPVCRAKCIACGSTNLRKITTGRKVGSVLMWGIFAAGKVSKTWHCNNCGTEF